MPRLDLERSGATTVRLDGRELLYFGGCGYLGLAHHPDVVRAAREGLERFGISAGASRETSGNARVHDELERRLANDLSVEGTVLMPEGYLANLALAQALASECRVALIDELGHPSLFDAARASGLAVETYAHLDVESAARALARFGANTIVMSDSVFPSRSEVAPLAALHAAAARAGAWLAIDDCHGTGVIGATGRGALEHGELPRERVALTTTLSKALGCYGGVVAGERALIERVRETSLAYVGTTPIPPALASAALVALELAYASPSRVEALRASCALFRDGLHRRGFAVGREPLPVVALALDDDSATRRVHDELREDGFLVPYVRYPGDGPRGKLRAVVTAAHTQLEIERLLDALARRWPAISTR